MKARLFALCVGLFLLAALRLGASGLTYANPVYVTFNTSVGNISVELFTSTPYTTANFLNYVDSGAYNNSIIHRSISNFIIQGGGYYFTGTSLSNLYSIPENTNYTTNPLMSEAAASQAAGNFNTTGTLAMALSTGTALGTSPLSGDSGNTASTSWFFNLGTNSALDSYDSSQTQGPFTVFGTIVPTDSASLSVMNQIAAVPVFAYNSPFDNLPLLNFTSADFNGGQGLPAVSNFVFVNSITRAVLQDFPTWQTAKSTGGPTATPQNDGVPNLLKYFCDIDPTRPMSPSDHAALPVSGTTTISGTQYLTITYRQYALKTGVTAVVQTSSDLKTWTPLINPTIMALGNDTTTANNDPIFQVVVSLTGAKQFIRLSVTTP